MKSNKISYYFKRVENNGLMTHSNLNIINWVINERMSVQLKVRDNVPKKGRTRRRRKELIALHHNAAN